MSFYDFPALSLSLSLHHPANWILYLPSLFSSDCKMASVSSWWWVFYAAAAAQYIAKGKEQRRRREARKGPENCITCRHRVGPSSFNASFLCKLSISHTACGYTFLQPDLCCNSLTLSRHSMHRSGHGAVMKKGKSKKRKVKWERGPILCPLSLTEAMIRRAIYTLTITRTHKYVESERRRRDT